MIAVARPAVIDRRYSAESSFRLAACAAPNFNAKILEIFVDEVAESPML